ncbi:tRNA (5-methylaminomethyl-2-thiouridine)(34)-methyltransferase MnmD [Methanobacterium alcaliphilum]|uniref:tRNA (5-methylaminomethyl-2-thiouridine)(34)-methyltransferase MnmD n=1 Tax=Methanobacterium alcaliphilum TaxID=392018 RepID=UPI00200A11F4|nr:MnmC family methyltransferase [Methanobacterium alcaliphilum]MCK9151631.1 MnmC family methyltransferase [Methanobacterium alcaliphilum]
MTSKTSNSLTPQKKALSLVKYYFQKEIKGDCEARKMAKKEIFKYLIKTDDGSYTLKSEDINGDCEAMHTVHGAITESLEKYVKPSNLTNKKNIKVLDICSGLGYNSAALIDYLQAYTNQNIKICLDLVEISIETLACGLFVPSPVNSHDIVKKAIEEHLINNDYAKFKFEKVTIPPNINFSIFSKDAREIMVNINSNHYDAIFLDPFSPLKAPELYTVEFLSELKRIIKEDGILTTYTSAAPVRSALVKTGFHIGEGPSFGRKSGGTVASLSLKNISQNLKDNDERMIALSDAGIPFRDPHFNLVSQKILKNRDNERKEVRGKTKLSSAVKTPIFLGKDIKMDKLGRRVTRNINKLNIPDLKSKYALFLICLQSNYCICGCNQKRISNSRDRIINMSERLSEISKYS